MRLTYITPVALPSTEANTIHVMRMCQAFSAAGHHVELLAPRGEDKNIPELHSHYGVSNSFKIRRWRGPSIPGGTELFSAAAAVFSRARRPDLIYTRSAVAASYCTGLGLPTVLEAHFPPSSFRCRDLVALKRACARRSLLRIVVISDALREAFSGEYPPSEGRLFVAHDGADADPTTTTSIPWPEGGFRAVYAGHLYRGKGIDVLVAIAKLVPDITFEVFGGKTEDIRYWRATTMGVSSIRFMGFIPPAAVAARLRTASVLLAPYQRSVFGADGTRDISRFMSPLKIFEYMAAARPIIASDLPVLREVLTHGETALLCPPDKPAAWADAIELLRRDWNFREKLGLSARALLEREYTWARRAQRVLQKLPWPR